MNSKTETQDATTNYANNKMMPLKSKFLLWKINLLYKVLFQRKERFNFMAVVDIIFIFKKDGLEREHNKNS